MVLMGEASWFRIAKVGGTVSRLSGEDEGV
jgi:hypothetical protein